MHPSRLEKNANIAMPSVQRGVLALSLRVWASNRTAYTPVSMMTAVTVPPIITILIAVAPVIVRVPLLGQGYGLMHRASVNEP